MIRQRTFLLVGSLMLAGLVALPSDAAIVLRAGKIPQPQGIEIVSYLPEENEALAQALLIHNLMNDMPNLRDAAQAAEGLEQQKELMEKILSQKSSCNVKKMGKVFKKPQEVWDKLMADYEQQRQSEKKKSDVTQTELATVSLQDRLKEQHIGWDVSREILMDLYKNPEKWGEVNKGASFPLWQDQVSLFEKQWTEFYEALNSAYGVPLKGRPAVDEDTRHNPKKYDVVLAAHKAYLKQISQGKRPIDEKIASQNPPQAPQALPRWQDIVRIDEITEKPVPELPEPWKKMSDNQFKNYASNGEMASFFDGKSLTPSEKAKGKYESALEEEYNMKLVVDSLEQGSKGSLNAQKEMTQPFIERLKDLGIDIPDFDVSNRAQYTEVQKQLKALKKKAIEDAYEYVARLEEQDKNNPDYVAKRNQLKSKKMARLSPEAQQAMENTGIIQIEQMSPVVQQRLVLAALEKDDKASVYLTETNAIDVDQLMRERRSTDKIVAESYQKINSSLEKQREIIPQLDVCQF